MLYAPVYLTDEALSELYSGMPDNTAGLSPDYLSRTQEGYFNFLREHCSMEGDFFELGPDVGLFTQFAAASPRLGKFWLYEPNRNVHAKLSECVSARTFEIRTEMKDFSAIPDGSLAVCVLIHVLDHLPDVGPVMRELRKKLRADGKMLIVTHDEHSWASLVFGRRWPPFCLQHPLLFSRKTTATFLASAGLEVVETRKSVNYFPITYIIKHVLYASGLKWVSNWNWNALVIPMKLGNIMTVAVPNGSGGAPVRTGQ